VALKATGIVTGYDRQSNDTFRVRLDIYSGEDNASGVLADPPFVTGDSESAVNTALVAFVRLYSETAWSVVFGLSDLIKIINPYKASVMSASGSALLRLGIYILPWESYRMKLR
jgi:hypothetical protein